MIWTIILISATLILVGYFRDIRRRNRRVGGNQQAFGADEIRHRVEYQTFMNDRLRPGKNGKG